MSALRTLFFVGAVGFSASAISQTEETKNPLKVVGEAAFDFSVYSNNGVATPSLYAGAQDNTYNFNSAQAWITYTQEKFLLQSRLYAIKNKYSDTDVPSTRTQTHPALDQLEVYHLYSDKLQFGFGRLSTLLGLESYMRHENPIYINTIAYSSLLPAYGDGARLVWLQSDLLKLTASTYNEISIASPWDEKSKTRKAWELVAQGSSENWSYSLGSTTGRNELGTQITFIDAWISYAFSEQTTFWFNFDRQTQEPAAGKTRDASSSIFQVQHKIDNHALALRYESVDGADDPMINIDGNYTGNVSVLSIADRVKLSENLSIALEVHHHMAQNKDYVDSSNKATKELTFFTVGALATF